MSVWYNISDKEEEHSVLTLPRSESGLIIQHTVGVLSERGEFVFLRVYLFLEVHTD